MPAKMPEALVARPFAAKLRCVGFELHHRRLPLPVRGNTSETLFSGQSPQ